MRLQFHRSALRAPMLPEYLSLSAPIVITVVASLSHLLLKHRTWQSVRFRMTREVFRHSHVVFLFRLSSRTVLSSLPIFSSPQVLDLRFQEVHEKLIFIGMHSSQNS